MEFNYKKSFPDLIHVRDVDYMVPNGDTGIIRQRKIYKLDWSIIDKQKEEEYKRWLEPIERIPERIGVRERSYKTINKTQKTLPKKYDDWVKNLEFDISRPFLKEIQHLTKLFQTEWNRSRGLGSTHATEVCLDVPISAAKCAFDLLSQCAYDSENDCSYNRNDDYILIKHALLYKFWVGKTGRGLVKNNSGFDRLESFLKEKNNFFSLKQSKSIKKVIRDFIKEIDCLEDKEGVYRPKLLITEKV